MKKVLLKKIFVCILIVVTVGNFALTTLNANNVYAEGFSIGATGSNIITGLIRSFIISCYIIANSYINWNNEFYRCFS